MAHNKEITFEEICCDDCGALSTVNVEATGQLMRWECPECGYHHEYSVAEFFGYGDEDYGSSPYLD